MQTIYRPRGKALEYAHLGLELYRCNKSEQGGCTHGCRYCYAPACLHITPRDFRTCVRPREGILKAIDKAGPKWSGTDARVLLSFFGDPYTLGTPLVTQQALEILSYYEIPFVVLTKAPATASRDFDLYHHRDAFATTLTIWDENWARRVEPRAESPQQRRHGLEAAKFRGIHTWVSLEPVLDVDEALRCIDWTRDVVDLYKVGILNHLPSKINWRDFGLRVLAKLDHYGKPYYIKKDLARHLQGVTFHNTDNRTTRLVKR